MTRDVTRPADRTDLVMTDRTPHEPTPSPVPTAPGVPPTVASLLQRLSARVLDTGIVGMLAGILHALYSGPWPDHLLVPEGLDVLAFFALPPAVYFVYEGALLARDGQTVGKKAVGIRVAVYADGSPPARRGWARAAVYALPGVFAGPGYLFWLFNVLSCLWGRPYRQCLHDKSAKTVVVTA